MKDLFTLLKQEQNSFHPVVPFDPEHEKLLLLDFTDNNKELSDEILNDTIKFSAWINEKLSGAGAKYGIGGYAEHRTVYRVSSLFNDSTEPRRIHLGADIWGKPQTKVMAPLQGIVHSFAFNNNFGDYGATIILSHSLQGNSFYTLYGHLSLSSLKNIQEGEAVKKGDVFAEFGIPAENGHWPPHLHFQLIIDLGDWQGDYPGVCKYSEKEKYLANSPDPDVILQLNKHLE
jgi:murein DD-endopeptidase MepM/ murein hydrolase activator NlpD